MYKIFSLLAVTLILAGCSTTDITAPNQTTTPTANATPEAAVQNITPKSTPASAVSNATLSNQTKAPIQLFIAIDKSGSTTDNRIPTLTTTQLLTLLQGISDRGGEVRIETVCSQSDRTMQSIRFTEAIKLPASPSPMPSQGTYNPLDKPALTKAAQAREQAYQQDLAKVQQQAQAKKTTDQSNIDRYVKTMTPALQKAANCPATDLLGAMQQGTLYLQEPATTWTTQPIKIGLLITDGIETTNKQITTLPWPSTTPVVTVSGGKGVGLLQQLNPVQFGNIDAAINHILSR
jgi:hypothetical protein